MSRDFINARYFVPAIVFLTVGGLFVALWRIVRDRDSMDVERQIVLAAEQVATRIEERMQVSIGALYELRDDWQSGLVTSRSIFERRARSVLAHQPGLASIDWLDNSDAITWSVPIEDHLVPLRPSMDSMPLVRPALHQAKRTREPCITPPIDLQPGLIGLVIFIPLELESEHEGMLSGSILVAPLIEESISSGLGGSFRFVVYDEDDAIFDTKPHETSAGLIFFESRRIRIGDRVWHLGVAPTRTLMSTVENPGIHLSLLLGLLVAGGMAFVSSRLLTSQESLRENEERLRAVAEHIPGVMYSYETCVGKPRSLVYLGPGLDSIIGPNSAGEVAQRFDRLFELLHPADRLRISEEAEDGMKTGQTVHCEARLLTDDGSYRWVRTLSRPLRVDSERVRWHIVLIDISEHRRTIDALRESEERYRLLVESSPIGVFIHRDSVFQFVSPAGARLLGYERAEELMGQEIYVVVPPERRPIVMRRLSSAGSSTDVARYGDERLLRKDGSEVDVEVYASTIIFGGAMARQILVLDTTEQREAEHRQRLLMQELDHRVKNNLASVLALLDQTAASTSDIEAFRTSFANRIKAMARTHEMLARTKWSGVEISEIVQLSLAPYIVEETARVNIEGTPLVIRPRLAMPIGLALHELATNALKYGSLSRAEGRIDVRWSRCNGLVTLCWSESGGPAVESPEDFGTGLRLVRGLVEFELGGSTRFDFAADGLVCTLSIKAEALTEALA